MHGIKSATGPHISTCIERQTMSGILKRTPIVKQIQKKINQSKPMRTDSSSSLASIASLQSEATSKDMKKGHAARSVNEKKQERVEEGEELDPVKQFAESFAESLNQKYADITKNPLDEIASTAALLGVLFGLGGMSLFVFSSKAGSLYLMALATFHFLEFWATARYNPTKVHSESFIINNGSAYTLAHTLTIIEYGIEYYLFPQFKLDHQAVKVVGFLMLIGGQAVRTFAMKTAGESFNHLVQIRHQKDHELVTRGVYYYLRHPSYFGFFWWAIGSQLMLLNPVGIIGFAITLYQFFSERIKHEERFLVTFFGERYEQYRVKTPTYIPFIN